MKEAVLVTKDGTNQHDLYHPYCFGQMAGGAMYGAFLLRYGGPDETIHFQEVSERGTCVFCHRHLSAEPPDLLEGLSRTLPNGGITWVK